jgi:hypothetical protein
VADFYHRHGFTYPGQLDGISEVGARHDFIHVLADYPPTPEGEIDVFALIAAAMPDPRGFTQFAMTLGLFQNGAIRHVAGKRIKIARTDTLADPGAPSRWADAMRRGAACTADVLNVDHFAMKDLPLEEARAKLGLLPKAVPGPVEPVHHGVHHADSTAGHAQDPAEKRSRLRARVNARIRWPTSST